MSRRQPRLVQFASLPITAAIFLTTPVWMTVPTVLAADEPAAAEKAAEEKPVAEKPAAKAADAEPDRAVVAMWADFNHYVRIARFDLAAGAGKSLLEKTNEPTLLELVEKGDYPDYDATLIRASKVDALKDISTQIADRIQTARIARSRDPERIAADIKKLAEGERANFNAVQRLRSAGQYAAPALLATLNDSKQSNIHPYLIPAMVSIGRPLVYPLSVALPKLEPVQQAQVAQILADIGYPRAVPYLKQVLEDKTTTASTRKVVDAAYRQLAGTVGIPLDATAAELFLTLAQNHYDATSKGRSLPGFDAADGKGVVWAYPSRDAGLVAIDVPPAIFGDVLTMRAAQTALQLDPNSDAALSLWLMSNLRRANHLTGDLKDQSYPADMMPPKFYLEMAGPLRQKDVLERALNDKDTRLALDAIGALGKTAGAESLSTIRPLMRALSYPDRRVRYNAAFAVAHARPKSEFPNAQRVTTVLCEALRQSDTKFAVALGRDEATRNRLAASIKELGYVVVPGTTVGDVSVQLGNVPNVDLVVTDLPLEATTKTYGATNSEYKLGAAPVVAILSPAEQLVLPREMTTDPRFTPVALSSAEKDAKDRLKNAIDMASKSFSGMPVAGAEAEGFANSAITIMRDIALGSTPVLKASDLQPALIEALADKRGNIALQAGQVLAMLPTKEAQTAIAKAAFDPARDEAGRIDLLLSLADSATANGNQLDKADHAKLLELVRTSTGDTAQAAARAHGALNLPTNSVVQLINGK